VVECEGGLQWRACVVHDEPDLDRIPRRSLGQDDGHHLDGEFHRWRRPGRERNRRIPDRAEKLVERRS
jgi:hypothetical protein